MRLGEILFKPLTIVSLLGIYLLLMVATQLFNVSPPVKDASSSAVLGVGNTGPSEQPVLIRTSTPHPDDTSKPTVVIGSPWTSSIVKSNSTITISATASDNYSVDRVEFYINNKLECTDVLSPYSCIWIVPAEHNKVYTITAKAVDSANNQSDTSVTIMSD
jgi:hypothetical protein